MKKSAISKIVGISASGAIWLSLAQAALAQTTATGSAASKGGTASSLPAAGSTEITYFLLLGGAILFILGAVKLVASFRD